MLMGLVVDGIVCGGPLHNTAVSRGDVIKSVDGQVRVSMLYANIRHIMSNIIYQR